MSKQSLTHHHGLEPEQHKQALVVAVLVIQGTKEQMEGQMRGASAKGRCEGQV